jgi:NADPH-dependent 2,4-dienoyl-CoA reductase/sulfur reductase-like enzyme
MKALRAKIENARKVAIIGGGFIGAEFADELAKMPGKETHLIEIMPKLLFTAFDDEFCDQIAGEITKAGVHVDIGSHRPSVGQCGSQGLGEIAPEKVRVAMRLS